MAVRRRVTATSPPAAARKARKTPRRADLFDPGGVEARCRRAPLLAWQVRRKGQGRPGMRDDEGAGAPLKARTKRPSWRGTRVPNSDQIRIGREWQNRVDNLSEQIDGDSTAGRVHGTANMAKMRVSCSLGEICRPDQLSLRIEPDGGSGPTDRWCESTRADQQSSQTSAPWPTARLGVAFRCVSVAGAVTLLPDAAVDSQHVVVRSTSRAAA
jgi:hypothetical protein